MMSRVFILLGLFLTQFLVMAQNSEGSFNPYVNQGIFELSPILTQEANPTGELSFKIGNTGSDPLDMEEGQHIRLIITLSDGEPDNENPIAAIGGAYAGLFSWTYSEGVYTGVQSAIIPASSAGNVTIDYSATTFSNAPGSNGFDVRVETAEYQSISNTGNDDAVSSYAYMAFKDFGDAPASYGLVYHILDYVNYLGVVWDAEGSHQSSPEAEGDNLAGSNDEDGVVFPEDIQQGDTSNLEVNVTGQGFLNGWLDWNADGDFDDAGERIAENVLRYEGTESLEIFVPEDAVITVPTYARFRFTPQLLSTSDGEAFGGEVEDYMVSISASRHAPKAPEGLQFDEVSDAEVSISWDVAAGEIGVTSYNVYRNGIYIGTSEDRIFTDHSVYIGEFYSYSVTAINASGYESDRSRVVAILIEDTTPPTTPYGIVVNSADIDGVQFSWESSTDNVGVLEYRVYRSGSLLETVNSLSYTDYSVSLNKSYTYTVSAIDEAGNESALSPVFAVLVADVSPPSVPVGISVQSVTEEEITIAWEPSSDNVGVIEYRVYRMGNPLKTVSTLSYMDSDVLVGETYSYNVSALDASGNESSLSEMLTITLNATSASFKETVNLSIYPNPSDGNVFIDVGISGKYTLEIISSSGLMVYQKTIHLHGDTLPLNIEYFQPGVYFVRIFDNDQNYTGKIMLVK